MPPSRTRRRHLDAAARAARADHLEAQRAARLRASPNRLTRYTQAYHDAANRLDDLLLVVERLLHIMDLRGLKHPYAPLFQCYEDASLHAERARCLDFRNGMWNEMAVVGYAQFVRVVAEAQAFEDSCWGWHGTGGVEIMAEVGEAAKCAARAVRRAGAAVGRA